MSLGLRAGLAALVARPQLWALVVACWAAFAMISFAWQYDRLERDALEMATLRGRLVFSMVQITRAWNAAHGGIYAVVTPASPANPYLKHPDKSAVTARGRALTMINPAYMTRQINEMLAQESDLRIHLTSLKPINPNNAADAWERRALISFESGAQEQTAFQTQNNTSVFRYMAPLPVKQPCMACHASQGYKVGQVRGGLSVTQPASYITGIIESQKTSITLIHLAAFLLLSAVSVLSLWLIRRQIEQVEDERDQRKRVAEELSVKVDELERTRDQLVLTEKHASLGRMAAGFAHELNTPVGIALGAVSQHEETLAQLRELMTRDEVGEEEFSARFDTLQQADRLAVSNLNRAADLVRNFKRTSIDQASDARRDFDVAELVRDVVAGLQIEFRKTAIRINVDCPDGLVVHSEPGLLVQLLNNLLLNSLQHGFNQGALSGNIQIKIELDQSFWLKLEYRDDGAGMPAEVAEKAFEPFFTTARGQGGSGLGLYVSYNIVTAQLGGEIRLTSAPGQGSCFDIRFPCNPA